MFTLGGGGPRTADPRIALPGPLPFFFKGTPEEGVGTMSPLSGRSRSYLRSKMNLANTRDKWRQAAVYGQGTDVILFVPTDDMWTVHEHGGPGLSVETIAAASRRDAARIEKSKRRLSETVSAGLIYQWLRAWRGLEWYEAWQIRKIAPPAGVFIATREEVARCRAAWDWRRICQSVKLDVQDGFNYWILRRRIPDRRLLRWLFGWLAPKDVLILPEPVQRLREEMSMRGILRAAGEAATTIRYWTEHPKLKRALDDVAAFVQAPRHSVEPLSPAWRERHAEVRTDTVKRMSAYADAQRRVKCFERAGLHPSSYSQVRDEARRLGVLAELDKYLKFEQPYSWEQSMKSGLVAGGRMYLASSGMWLFRAEAEGLRTKQGIPQLEVLPHFDDWFYDWTRPHADGGKRIDLPEVAELADHHLPANGQREQPPRQKRGRRPGTIDKEAQARDQKIKEVLKEEQQKAPDSRKSQAQIAREFEVHESHVSRLVHSRDP